MSEKLDPDFISEADLDAPENGVQAQAEHDANEDAGVSDAADAPNSAEEAQLDEAENFNELGCIGFVLAKRTCLLGEIRTRFQSPEGSAECLDGAWMKPMIGACSQAERAESSRCMEWFLPGGRRCRARRSRKKIQPKQGS